ncbi:MAG TPA: nucleoside hydrolase [Geminicoccaceae bacterium]|nr:nucleoside hydrolase [Geminicoccus sp.]HMU52644.1 nucleoside hydrolase [Geminicoccaceae bacterium]
MAPLPIIIDCDPGQDDAIALLLALASPEDLEVLAITAVAGNVPLRLTEHNARRIVQLAGRPEVPVFAGCDRPLLRALETAEYVHGETGLDGAVLADPGFALAPGHAVDAIIDLAMARPAGSVTLCPIGPLTNIAMALRKEPRLTGHLGRIALMGGSIELGNVTPAAEFNIFVDPHAADIVFRSGVPLVMFGLDVTHKALVTEPHLRRIEALGTPVAKAAAGLLDFYNRFDRERYSQPGGPLHDPCVIAWLLDPGLFEGKACPVEIVLEGPSAGRTLVDWWNMHKHPANATVMRNVDAERFFDLLIARLARL